MLYLIHDVNNYKNQITIVAIPITAMMVMIVVVVAAGVVVVVVVGLFFRRLTVSFCLVNWEEQKLEGREYSV